MVAWVDRIGPYRVEWRESRRPSGQAYLSLGANPSFCIHTTEGTTVDGAWSTLDSKHAAPHFIIGQDRIVQCRPLTAQGAALVSHNDRFIQVEVVGRSSLALWLPAEPSLGPLVALSAFVHGLGVPMYRPPEWSDLLADRTWANDNPRRQDRYALSRRGFYGHVDVPDQSPTWHWDPGSLHYASLFDRVRGSAPTPEDEMTEEQKQMLREALALAKGAVESHDQLEAGVRAALVDPEMEAPADAHPSFRLGVRLVKRAVTLPLPTVVPPAEPHNHPHTHETGVEIAYNAT